MKLPEIPEPVKRYAPWVVGGVVGLVALSKIRTGGTSAAPAASTGAALPSNPYAYGAGVGTTTTGSGVSSVGNAVTDQIAAAQAALNQQLSAFDAMYLPIAGAGAASVGTSSPRTQATPTSGAGGGLSRFDYYNNSQLAYQRGQLEIAAQGQKNQLATQKAQQDLANKQKDRDNNVFLNPTTIITKGIPKIADAVGSIGKLFRF